MGVDIVVYSGLNLFCGIRMVFYGSGIDDPQMVYLTISTLDTEIMQYLS